MILIIIRSSYNASYNNQFIRERDGVRKSGEPDERVARKPGKNTADSNQHTVGLRKEILGKRKYDLLLDPTVFRI